MGEGLNLLGTRAIPRFLQTFSIYASFLVRKVAQVTRQSPL